MSKWLTIFVFSLLGCNIASAEVITRTVEYRQGDSRLVGYLAYPSDNRKRHPGVLVAPEWWGLNDYAKGRAEQLAELGYVALAIDIYGEGKTTTDPQEAAALAKTYKENRTLLRDRVRAGLETLKVQPMVDGRRLAAIGYCFGGTAVLELARDGADLSGVVSFHGGLDTSKSAQAKQIRASILVLHGADDPLVTPEQLADFQEEMRAAGTDWQLVAYGNAVHGFTNPAAGTDKSRGVAYSPLADRRSWQAMQRFLAELFEDQS
jgi:dienelactone hydrolase